VADYRNRLVGAIGLGIVLATATGIWVARDRTPGAGAAAEVSLPEQLPEESENEVGVRVSVGVATPPLDAPNAEEPDSILELPASEIVARLARRELNFRAVADLSQETRDQVCLEIAKTQFAIFSEDRRRSELEGILRIALVERNGTKKELPPSGASEFENLQARFLANARPLAEAVLSEIELDLQTKWERGEGVVLWHDGEPRPNVEWPHGESGLFETMSSGTFGYGVNVGFSYSSSDSPSIQNKLREIREMKHKLLEGFAQVK